MAKTRLPYASEFRRQMVELVHAGRTPEELAPPYNRSATSALARYVTAELSSRMTRKVPGSFVKSLFMHQRVSIAHTRPGRSRQRYSAQQTSSAQRGGATSTIFHSPLWIPHQFTT